MKHYFKTATNDSEKGTEHKQCMGVKFSLHLPHKGMVYVNTYTEFDDGDSRPREFNIYLLSIHLTRLCVLYEWITKLSAYVISGQYTMIVVNIIAVHLDFTWQMEGVTMYWIHISKCSIISQNYTMNNISSGCHVGQCYLYKSVLFFMLSTFKNDNV